MCVPAGVRFDDDTFFVPSLAATTPVPVDVRDPRTRSFGHIDPANMDPRRQTQDQLAVSASMRTALLVYSGITVKMMVDSDLGAQLQTMFMVQYEPGGMAGTHDHPLEETYLVLEGEVDASFDGDVHRLRPGDVAWAGVGCVHGFSNPADRPVRWLETQAPQPPARHSYRFTRDWDYLRTPRLKGSSHAEPGASSSSGDPRLGLGWPATTPARAARSCCRPRPGRAEAAAAGRRRQRQRLALDLARPELAGPGRVQQVGHLVWPRSTGREHGPSLTRGDPPGHPEAGRLRRDRPPLPPDGPDGRCSCSGAGQGPPYPGSTMVSTVNGGVTGLSTPGRRARPDPAATPSTPASSATAHTGAPRARPPAVPPGPRRGAVTMEDVVGAVVFLLENRSVNGVNLAVDGGWLLL
jgi:quercetin dioxygenase-like cupin family protein